MKTKLPEIKDKLPSVLEGINKVLKEHNLDNIFVNQIYFSEHDGCPPGYERRCKYYGNDPVTQKPIIKCKCVPIG